MDNFIKKELSGLRKENMKNKKEKTLIHF